MSRIQKVIEILDAFLSKRGKVQLQSILGQDFDSLCTELFEVADGFEFISDFATLLVQIEEDISRVPNLKEGQRKHYAQQLQPLRSLFGSKTYLWSWEQFFKHIGAGNLRNSLMLMDPLLDPERYNLRRVPDRQAVTKELSELEKAIKSSSISAEVKRLLNFEILKMRMILENEKSFKETKIWEQYEKLTAQLVAVVLGLDQAERNKFMESVRKLAGRVREGLGLAADVAAIADATAKLPLL